MSGERIHINLLWVCVILSMAHYYSFFLHLSFIQASRRESVTDVSPYLGVKSTVVVGER